MKAENVTDFDSFGVEHIPKKCYIIYLWNRIQAYNSIMCGYFCIGFIEFMLKGKSLLECKNLFSPNEYKKNDKLNENIFNRIQISWTNENLLKYCNKYRKRKNPNISNIF